MNTLFSPRFRSEICLLSCSNSRKRNWSLWNHEGGCPKGRRHSRVCLAASVG